MMQDESQEFLSTSTSTPSASNGGSLFNADEVRFMDDSLSSAASFDPFTMGSQGFKVPNILPANLGGIGSVPRDFEQQGQNGSSHLSPQQQQHQQQYPHNKRQSQSPATNTNMIRGGYGRDKAWQLQQLEALQAESERYRNSKPEDTPSSSSMPDFTNTARTGSSLNAIDGDLSWLDQDPIHSFKNGSYTNVGQPEPMLSSASPYPGQKAPSTSHNLAHLGLQFPSSHHFPAAPGNEESSSKRQRRNKGEETAGMKCDDDAAPRRGRSPNARPPWTQPPDLSKSQFIPTSKNQTGQLGAASASTSTTSAAQRNSFNVDFDTPYTYLPAPKPPPKTVDLSGVAGKSKAIPSQISDAFFAPKLPRYQPHLVVLREEQKKRKERGLSANIRKGDKKINTKQEQGSPDGNEGDGDKKKGHTLLTDAEKKANHIASEQKRRANIRKGYEMLCDLVPALREDGEGGGPDDEGMEEDGDGEDDEVKRGKRRRGYETSGGGDRIEGRTGPRSEAAILMAAVEHLRNQLENHKQLVIQKQEAQLRVAQRFGLDIRADPSSSTSNDTKQN